VEAALAARAGVRRGAGGRRLDAPLVQSGKPESIEKVRTIADSWARLRRALQLRVCRRYVDELVLVSDDQLRAAMRLLFAAQSSRSSLRAAAATRRALCGPLAREARRQAGGGIVCGANHRRGDVYETDYE